MQEHQRRYRAAAVLGGKGRRGAPKPFDRLGLDSLVAFILRLVIPGAVQHPDIEYLLFALAVEHGDIIGVAIHRGVVGIHRQAAGVAPENIRLLILADKVAVIVIAVYHGKGNPSALKRSGDIVYRLAHHLEGSLLTRAI